ncbi:MAG: Dickkopf N-terminal cysteine-rich domain-containing protein [Myxococcales bacterium]
MTRRLNAVSLAALFLGAACPGQHVSPGPDAAAPKPDAAAIASDASQLPPDAAFRCIAPDAGALSTLASLCEDLVAGEARLAHDSKMKCPGEPLELADMPHLSSSFIERCEPGTRRESDLRRLEAKIAAGRVGYDPAKHAACKALDPVDAGLPILDGGVVIEPCRSILVGKVAQGAACDIPEECAPGLYCRFTSTTVGTCEPVVAEGQPCQPDLETCMPGTWCFTVVDGGTPVCRGLPGLGESCSGYCAVGRCVGGVCTDVPLPGDGQPCSDQGCSDGLGCAGRTDAGPGTCRPLATQGEACNGANPPCGECLSCSQSSGGTCQKYPAEGDSCAPDAGAALFGNLAHLYCQPSGTLALKPRTGQPCTAASSCLYEEDYCRFMAEGASEGLCMRRPGMCEPCGRRFDLTDDCLHGRCFYTEALVGVCAPQATDGEGCDGQALRCADGLACVAGRCKPLPSAAGAPCGDFGTCAAGLYCPANDSGVPTCLAKQASGEPCASDDQCLTGLCSDQGRCLAGPSPENAVAKGCWAGSAFEYFGYVVFFAAVLRRRSR